MGYQFTSEEKRRQERFENVVLTLMLVGGAAIFYGPVVVEWFRGVF